MTVTPPVEILEMITGYIPLGTIPAWAATSRLIRDITQHQRHWEKRCKLEFDVGPPCDGPYKAHEDWKEVYRCYLGCKTNRERSNYHLRWLPTSPNIPTNIHAIQFDLKDRVVYFTTTAWGSTGTPLDKPAHLHAMDMDNGTLLSSTTDVPPRSDIAFDAESGLLVTFTMDRVNINEGSSTSCAQNRSAAPKSTESGRTQNSENDTTALHLSKRGALKVLGRLDGRDSDVTRFKACLHADVVCIYQESVTFWDVPSMAQMEVINVYQDSAHVEALEFDDTHLFVATSGTIPGAYSGCYVYNRESGQCILQLPGESHGHGGPERGRFGKVYQAKHANEAWTTRQDNRTRGGLAKRVVNVIPIVQRDIIGRNVLGQLKGITLTETELILFGNDGFAILPNYRDHLLADPSPSLTTNRPCLVTPRIVGIRIKGVAPGQGASTSFGTTKASLVVSGSNLFLHTHMMHHDAFIDAILPGLLIFPSWRKLADKAESYDGKVVHVSRTDAIQQVNWNPSRTICSSNQGVHFAGDRGTRGQTALAMYSLTDHDIS